MARELERKFLLGEPAETWPGEPLASSAAEINQGYLTPAEAPIEVRLRKAREVTPESARRLAPASVTGPRGVNQLMKLTIKGEAAPDSPTSLDREEVELDLDPADFDALWPLTAARRIRKVRVSVSIRSDDEAMLNVSLDEFRGNLGGLKLIEVEFDTPELAQAFAVPTYFGAEVTADSRFRNSSLASATSRPGID